jgi:DNA-binding NarL/FixJ family response regulator
MEKSDPQGLSTQRRAIGLLLVDDHPLIRKGIIALIEDEPDMEVVAEAANGREAIEQYRIHRPSVTLMDLQMSELGGVDAIIAIRSEFPLAAIIVLTTYAFDARVLRAIKAGARAYLLKNLLHEELLHSIRAVHAGKRLLSPELSFRVAEHAGQDSLTPAELAVLQLIADGGSNKQIARRLGVTEETVKNRVKSILEKLGAEDRTQAAMIALRRGIIEL